MSWKLTVGLAGLLAAACSVNSGESTVSGIEPLQPGFMSEESVAEAERKIASGEYEVPPVAVATRSFMDKYDNAVLVRGILNYCGSEAISKTLLQKLVGAAVRHDSTHAFTIIQAVDMRATGVSIGLDMAELSPEQKEETCSTQLTLVEYAMEAFDE